MCGRFHIDNGMEKEILKILRQITSNLTPNIGSRDIYPTETAPVIYSKENYLVSEHLSWGFPSTRGKGIIFNSRSETAMEKQMFYRGIRNRRCLVPASGFYEWDFSKNKGYFTHQNNTPMFMAGFYDIIDNKQRFVILTTAANESMADVHTRMPLILEENELQEWIFAPEKVELLLKKPSPPLIGKFEYRQATLNFDTNDNMNH